MAWRQGGMAHEMPPWSRGCRVMRDREADTLCRRSGWDFAEAAGDLGSSEEESGPSGSVHPSQSHSSALGGNPACPSAPTSYSLISLGKWKQPVEYDPPFPSNYLTCRPCAYRDHIASSTVEAHLQVPYGHFAGNTLLTSL